MKLILLDVDMTLISARGAGMASLDAAMSDLFGIERGFEGVEFAGRTDRLIVEDGLSANGLAPSDDMVSRVREAYIRNLAGRLSAGWPASVLGGVNELLDLLTRREDACFGLLTGNWKEGAFLKLAACGIDRYFRFGAFAECGRMRRELIPHALGMAEAVCGRRPSPADTWIVGDTPHDVSCGRDWNLRTLGVATGPYGVETLAECGADAVLPDLSSTETVERIIFG
ncbi:MAG: HAD hydrolase-like protein [Candidatus Fermentibacter sp.]|nr:HAD hydrolase-like protein [Candidatus Fermentibacter sp.]